ncbi:MAG: transporter substrate-binding domain-containing protein [Marinobacter sp.]|uniref:substrate-binding periplasmic protein n=1 Tax=Marinobacter sp. TaxID=50741 RepID=UPI00299D1EBF|nr:transporter substrate-binding domain-containing protein [Marinobacter sp.]MDX1634074.1 transporter substrate-binding domain-containing protein [Marinobacter sp.]
MAVCKRKGLFAGLAAVLCLAGALRADETVTVRYLVVDAKTRPFQIVEDNQSRGGIVSDMVDAIFAGTDYEVTHQVLPVNRLRVQVHENRINHWVAFDAPVWNSFGVEGEMLAQPLFTTRHILLTCRTDLPARITSIDQLKDLSVVMLRHFDYLAISEAGERGYLQAVPVDRFEAGLSLVQLGRADGFVEMVSRLRHHLKAFPGNGDCFREVDLGPIIPDYPIHLSVDRDWSDAFKNRVSKRLEELADAGELDRIYRRYVPESLP